MEERVQQLEERIALLEYTLNKLSRRSDFYFDKDITFSNGVNISIGTTSGTQIGGSDSSLLSIYSATPVARQSAVAAPSGGGSSVTDAIDIQARARINDIRTRLSTFGITL